MIKRAVIIGVVIVCIIFLFMPMFDVYGANKELNPNITYEDKIRNLSKDKEYGQKILDSYNVKYDFGGFHSSNSIYILDGVLTVHSDDIVFSFVNSDPFTYIDITLNNSSISINENDSSYSNQELINRASSTKVIIDQYYNEYIESKYGCTCRVDCSIWDNFS